MGKFLGYLGALFIPTGLILTLLSAGLQNEAHPLIDINPVGLIVGITMLVLGLIAFISSMFLYRPGNY